MGLVAIGIGVEAVLRLFEPVAVAFGEAMIIAILGLAVNIVSAVLLSGNRDHRHGEQRLDDAQVTP
ncbi:hypothetical protein SPHINGO361_140315 [Sphingomonas sp. EC-HK361]|uniref:hypothetical protein n=1 Tax=Sphingomonas sp. EC-HK361 TaxID=2038397 RepID=UPI00125BD286|nr:hypothetical protein SPHINGO361_140315 [Sphingomonas sp. EC-HK361]